MDQYIETKAFKQTIAKLESQIDHLETEFDCLNQLLLELGFEEGIKTLKKTAKELLKEKNLKFF